MTKAQIVQAFVAIAKKEDGVRESNNNSGARVREYQAATTLGGTHWPWCAAYLSWCLKQTEKQADIKIPWSHSASCDVLWADAKSRGLIRATPQVGDIFLVKAKVGAGYSKSDAIHTGVVTEVEGDWFWTMEGNTNSGGGREGVAVMSHRRPISSRFVFIRWIDGVQNARLEDVKPEAWKVLVNDKPLTAFFENNTNYIGAKQFGEALALPVSWNAVDGEVTLKGEPVGAQPRLVDGRAYFPIRVLADHAGMSVVADAKSRVVRISK